MAAPIVAIIIPLLAAGPAFIVWRVCLRPYFMQVRMKRMGERVTETPTRQSAHSGFSVALNRIGRSSMAQALAFTHRASSEELVEERADEEVPVIEEAPEHSPQWFFLDEYGNTQGPCQHAHLKSWLETNALPSTTLIIPVDSTAAEDWRPLSDINKKVKPKHHGETSDAEDMQAWLGQQRDRAGQGKVVVSATPLEEIGDEGADESAADEGAAEGGVHDGDGVDSGDGDDATDFPRRRKKKRYGRGTVLFNTIDLGGADAKGRYVISKYTADISCESFSPFDMRFP